jgi:hypothetical protein
MDSIQLKAGSCIQQLHDSSEILKTPSECVCEKQTSDPKCMTGSCGAASAGDACAGDCERGDACADGSAEDNPDADEVVEDEEDEDEDAGGDKW